MNIGQASKASGVSAKMIRYYEQTGLIPKADRKDSGYRDYSPSDVHMLRFIRRARDLGFSVAEINDLLSLWRDTSRQSADVKRIAQAHIAQLQERIENLEQMAATLSTACGGVWSGACARTELQHRELILAATKAWYEMFEQRLH